MSWFYSFIIVFIIMTVLLACFYLHRPFAPRKDSPWVFYAHSVATVAVVVLFGIGLGGAGHENILLPTPPPRLASVGKKVLLAVLLWNTLCDSFPYLLALLYVFALWTTIRTRKGWRCVFLPLADPVYARVALFVQYPILCVHFFGPLVLSVSLVMRLGAVGHASWKGPADCRRTVRRGSCEGGEREGIIRWCGGGFDERRRCWLGFSKWYQQVQVYDLYTHSSSMQGLCFFGYCLLCTVRQSVVV